MESMTAKSATDSLLKSSMDLFLRYGVKNVSMDDIAKLLGISKKTIYAQVANKKELVRAAVHVFIVEEHTSITAITAQSKDAISEMLALSNQTIELVKNMKPTLTYDLKKYHPETWKIIETKYFSFIEETIMNNVTRGIAEGYFRKGINPAIISKLYLGMAHLVSSESFVKTNTISLKNLYKGMVDYHLNGIINEKGRNALNTLLHV